jgi:hypothetical protein
LIVNEYFKGARQRHSCNCPAWLLDLLDTVLSKTEYRCASQLIGNLLRFDASPDITNRILGRCGIALRRPEKSPDIVLRKAVAWLVHPMRFKTSATQQTRENWLDSQERRKKRQSVLLDPPPEERVRITLEQCERGDHASWPKLALELTLTPDARDYAWPKKPDELPGWQVATCDTRSQIGSVAMKYLVQATPDSDKLFSSTSYFFKDVAGLFAFEVLRQIAPDSLSHLGEGHWAKWAPLIMGGYHENQDWSQALRSEAYRYAPEAVLNAALRYLDKDDRREHGLTSLYEYDFLWGPAFIEGIVCRLDDVRFKLQSRRTILEALLKRGEPVGCERAHRFLAQGEDENLRRDAAALLLIYDCVNSWSALSALLTQEPGFSESFIAQVAYELRRRGPDEPAHSLNEAQLAELYLWMETRLRAIQGPPQRNTSLPTTRTHVKEFHDSLIGHLKSAGTWTAVEALEQISAALPDSDWLKWTCFQARDNAMNTQWQALRWNELLGLLGDPAARVIRTPGELQSVVLESLERLQQSLHGMTPLAPFLWDEAGGKPKSEGRLSDFIKFHLSNDLNRRGVLINREVELRNWPDKGRGESLDLLVQAVRHGEAPMDVIIEVKRCWNTGLETAMETQLRDRYLLGSHHTHGIYLVGWYGDEGGGKDCRAIA